MQKSYIKHGLLTFSLTAFFMVLAYSQVAVSINNLWNDHLVSMLALRYQPSSDILIIDIDDQSLREMESFAGKWPWPRSIHGFLLEGLKNYSTKAIVFDILFAEKDVFRPEADEFFNEMITQTPNVYLAGALAAGEQVQPVVLQDYASYLNLASGDHVTPDATARLTLPWVVPREQWRVGSIAFQLEADGIGRSYSVRNELSGWYWLSLPALVAKDLGHQLPDQNDIRLRWLGADLMPFNNISYSQLFDHLSHPEADHYGDLFKNKIVIIGSTATGLHDTRPTPVATNYPAVSILATALDNLLQDRYYRALPNIWMLIPTLVLLLFFTTWATTAKIYRTLFIWCWPICILIAMILFVGAYQGAKQGVLSNVAYPVFAASAALLIITLIRGLGEYFQRQKLIGIFSRFIDPRIVNQLIDEQQLEISTRSKSCQITVLFSDIRGFTTLSEQHSATEIVTLLNQYFSAQVETIFKYGGTLDKFIGDAIMAFWGAPIDDEQQADNAILAAKEMTENLEAFRSQLPESMRHFDVGIGLHTGEAVVGMIGSEKRYDYTAIGDTVNLASRIEGLTKDRARILVSEDCKNACQKTFDWVEMGSFQVKGREKPVITYCLEGSQL